MAHPIEPTPPLFGQDARNLLESLKNVAPIEEIARRKETAKQYFADMAARNAIHTHKILKQQ